MLRKTALFLCILLLASHAYATEWVSLSGNNPGEPVITATNNEAGHTILDIRLDGYYTENIKINKRNAVKLSLSGGVNETETGNPDMQHLAVSLQIPDRGKSGLSIISAEFVEYPNIMVAPSQGDPQFINPSNRYSYTNNELIYNRNEFYPGIIARTDAPYIWCDTRGLAVQVYPFSYNPATKILRVYHAIRIEISNTTEQGENELTRFSPDYGTLRGLRSAANGHFVNYVNSTRSISTDEPGNMLIITQSSFMEAFQPFIEWKARVGIVCEIVDVASLGNADAIKNFVSEYYYNHGLAYLLLAGDAEQVPSMQSENGASDNMYGYISGNDHYPEVLTGRFPAETLTQLVTMINRSIGYEMNPSNRAKYDSFLGIASELGPGDDGESDFEHIRKIGNTLMESGFSHFNEMYDGSQGGSDAQGNPAKSGVVQAINDGLGAIMYIGHGTKNLWQTSGFSGNEVNGLKNTETQPFIWSAGCSNGDFVASSCFAEAWLRAEYNGIPTGAVAVMMSTGSQSWYPPMEAQDEIALILAGRKASVTTRTFGGISMSACMKMNDKYGTGGYRVTDTWTIFGDPSIMVRTAPAKEILTHHASESGADTRVFVVKLPDSKALACITQHNKLLGEARAEDGFATISLLGPLTPDSITLTVTGFNLKPYTAAIAITLLPAKAELPSPQNKSRKVSVYAPLEWQTGTGMVPDFYEVFLAEGPEPEWSGNGIVVPGKSYSLPQKLAYNTLYTWKVISHNQHGQSESRNFTFTTLNPPDEDFESQGFPRNNWTNNSNNTWFIDGSTSFEGRFSLRSGAITHSDTSRLVYECYTPACDYLGFRKMISSQAGADKLQLIIDGLMVGEWSGQSPWSEETFAVEAGNHVIEWIYLKDGNGSEGMDAAWIDEIYLPVNEEAVLLTTNSSICANEVIYPMASVSGHSTIRWTSAGTGTFSDESDPNSAYYPSSQEITNGVVSLSILAYSNALCNPLTSELTITLVDLPQLPAVKDTVLYSGEKYSITMPESNVSSFKVTPEGLVDHEYIIDASNLRAGANEFTISTENETGCISEQAFIVTLIEGSRPSIGNGLTIYPNPASETINIASIGMVYDNFRLQVFDLSGRIVAEQNNSGLMPEKIDIGFIQEGVYIVRVQNGTELLTGRFIKII